jgi:hypothetical protein
MLGCLRTGRWVLEQETVSNWIDSGGPPRWRTGEERENEDQENEGLENVNGRGRRLKTLLTVGFAVLLLGLASQFSHARDHGQFASSTPEIKAWFDGLRSGNGPCCSDADGTAISDADWETRDGHYRVRVPRYGYLVAGQQQELVWVDVPEEAVITEPNRVGRTMVWPLYGYLGLTIRCFMPGSMT